jgi:hypothetical protein
MQPNTAQHNPDTHTWHTQDTLHNTSTPTPYHSQHAYILPTPITLDRPAYELKVAIPTQPSVLHTILTLVTFLTFYAIRNLIAYQLTFVALATTPDILQPYRWAY